MLVDNDPAVEITDALLTVAAHKYRSHRNAFVQLRLMLHSHCAGLNDFSAARMQVGLYISHLYHHDYEERHKITAVTSAKNY